MRIPLALVLLLAACSAPGVLVAENGEHRLVGSDRESGVSVVLTTGVWEGDPSFAAEATIVHTLVANNGTQPILLAPGDIDLTDVRGFRVELLDTGATFERVADQAAAAAYDRGLERSYDPGRSTDFEQVVVPGDIAREALPWGVLEPGTQMRGFLYFESMARATDQARLVWHFARPDHTPIVDVRFDLYVARAR